MKPATVNAINLGAACLAVALTPFVTEAQLASSGEVDPQGRVYTKIVARIADQAGGSQPIAGLTVYVVTENGDRVTLRTNSAGIAGSWLAKARYRFVTPDPVDWEGRSYTWDTITTVRPGLALLQLHLANAKPLQVPSTMLIPHSIAKQRPNPARASVPSSPVKSGAPNPRPMPTAGIVASGFSGPFIVWSPDDGSSDEILKDGHIVRIIVRDGLAVSASMIRSGDLMWAYVGISNRSSRRVDVDPETFTVRQLAPKQNSIQYRKPADLITSITRRAKIGAAISVIAGEMARTETVTEVNSVGTAATSGSSRTEARVRGFDPLDNARISATTYGTYSTTSRARTTIRTSAPDQIARANAAANAENIMARAGTKAEDILGRALLANTLMSGQDIVGAVFFERDKKAREVVLRIPLSGVTFEVPLSIR